MPGDARVDAVGNEDGRDGARSGSRLTAASTVMAVRLFRLGGCVDYR